MQKNIAEQTLRVYDHAYHHHKFSRAVCTHPAFQSWPWIGLRIAYMPLPETIQTSMTYTQFAVFACRPADQSKRICPPDTNCTSTTASPKMTTPPSATTARVSLRRGNCFTTEVPAAIISRRKTILTRWVWWYVLFWIASLKLLGMARIGPTLMHEHMMHRCTNSGV